MKAKDENETAKLGSFLFELLYELSAGKTKPHQNADLPELLRVLEIVLSKENPLEMLMERMGVSRFQLERMMRRMFNEPPMHLIIRYRLKRAAEMLVSTDLPVKEIAAHVGYHPLTRFCYCFRKAFCQTPKQCRSSGKVPQFLVSANGK